MINEPKTETIEWFDVKSKPSPERDCEVLILVRANGVIGGSYDKNWDMFTAEGSQYTPTHWAYMPKGLK